MAVSACFFTAQPRRNTVLPVVLVWVVLLTYAVTVNAQYPYPACTGSVCKSAPMTGIVQCNGGPATFWCCFSGSGGTDNCRATCSEPQNDYCPQDILASVPEPVRTPSGTCHSDCGHNAGDSGVLGYCNGCRPYVEEYVREFTLFCLFV